MHHTERHAKTFKCEKLLVCMQKAIEVTALTKRFGKFTAVDNISFNVNKGEFFAFLGPNGAGKTTTIKMLITLLAPDSGKIFVDGNDPVLQKDRVRKSIGVVFQDFSLDDELTAFENMQFHGYLYNIPGGLLDDKIKALLEIVQLWDRKDSLVKTFSGGMKRRLEIARGLLHEPAVYFLDEPTIGLDPQTRNQIWAHLKELNIKINNTVFFTTHYMEEAEKNADSVAIIDNGKIIAVGSPAQIKQRTKSKSLEEAFLKMTGKQIRQESASSADKMRMGRRLWRK